ncbi:titin-like [Pyrus ussuriensis x Pyrus communis]|uniref:Titin-like n=1 Tax=Pyrus ussuriensis x Pyrus communis TaxID=2448454 RepID=A0A5N5HS97_9ROSA|nr:titin-like [Pyrus ussuriensis x Pyrus communis]
MVVVSELFLTVTATMLHLIGKEAPQAYFDAANNCFTKNCTHLLYFGLDDFSAIDADTSNKSQSPKLERKKSLLPAVSEANRNINGQSSRFSLDEKVPQNTARGPSPVYPKKPQRKSLPRLPNFCRGELLLKLASGREYCVKMILEAVQGEHLLGHYLRM